MPLWPFAMLVLVFLAVLFLPPLIAAYIDHLSDRRRFTADRPGGSETRNDG